MSVADLIAILNQYPPELDMRVGGCHVCGTTHPAVGAYQPVGEDFLVIGIDEDFDKVKGL